MLLISMFMCGLLFLAADSLANSSDYIVEGSVYSQAVESSATLTNLQSISLASQFEHNRQAAKWSVYGVDDSLQPLPDADNHLLAESILPEWFIVTFTSKYRLSGWKDASLIYKIKNALI